MALSLHESLETHGHAPRWRPSCVGQRRKQSRDRQWDVARTVKAINPRVPVVYLTGAAHEIAPHQRAGGDAGSYPEAPGIPTRHASGAGLSGPVTMRLSRRHTGTRQHGNQQRPADTRQQETRAGRAPRLSGHPSARLGAPNPGRGCGEQKGEAGSWARSPAATPPPSGGLPMDRIVAYRARFWPRPCAQWG